MYCRTTRFSMTHLLLLLAVLLVSGCAASEPRPVIAHRTDALDTSKLTVTKLQELVSSALQENEYFGAAVAFSSDGTTLVVGAPARVAEVAMPPLTYSPPSGTTSGRAYVFVRTATGWTERATLKPTETWPTGGYGFGRSVALSRDASTIVIGAPYRKSGLVDVGAAYVFVRSGSDWIQQDRLDGLAGFHTGHAVAVSGDGSRVLVASDATGAVFVRSGLAWNQEGILSRPWSACWSAFYPSSVAISDDGGTAILGIRCDKLDLGAGASTNFDGVLHFERLGSAWTYNQLIRLTEKDSAGNPITATGSLAAMDESGANIIIGRRSGGDVSAHKKSGSIFSPHGPSLLEVHSTNFRHPVVISGSGLVGYIGSPHIWSGRPSSSGPVLRVSRIDGEWKREKSIDPSTSKDYLSFGYSISTTAHGELLAIGSPAADNLTTDRAGKVYIYNLLKPGGAACAAGIQCKSGFCVDGVCCNNACGGGANDDCQACSAAMGSSTDGLCETLEKNAVCHPSKGVCDPEEVCDGSSVVCPRDDPSPMGTLCRAAAGLCDKPEYCDGTSPRCPDDQKKTKTEPCTSGDCASSALCDGVSATCPDNPFKKKGEVCREPRDSDCFLRAVCPGDSAKCPDSFARESTHICHGMVDGCDVDEYCDGITFACPLSGRKQPKDTPCGKDGSLKCDCVGRCGAPSSCIP